MIQVSTRMGGTLIRMLANDWVSYADESDVTLLALKVRGYVRYQRGHAVRSDHWTLTEAGLTRARQLREEADRAR